MKKLLCFVLVFTGSYVCAANEETITFQVIIKSTNEIGKGKEEVLYEKKVSLDNPLGDLVYGDDIENSKVPIPSVIILKKGNIAMPVIGGKSFFSSETVRSLLKRQPGTDKIVLMLFPATGKYIKGD